MVSLPHHESPRRKALVSYIHSVNGVQQQMAYSLTKVLAAYRAFASEKTIKPGTKAKLDHAEKTLEVLRKRLAALEAPPDALRLRSDVLHLVTEETEITKEVDLLARFAPPFSAALTQLHLAAAALSKALTAVKTPTSHAIRGTKAQIAKAQAAFAAASDQAAASEGDAVSAYDAVVARTLTRLRRLQPPPALAPALESEVSGLKATYRAGERLATTLRQKNRANVAQLGRAFTIATRTSQSIGAQRAEIAAVKAYNARVHSLGAAVTAVQHEIARLQSVH